MPTSPTCLPTYLPACHPACLPAYLTCLPHLPACLPAYLTYQVRSLIESKKAAERERIAIQLAAAKADNTYLK